MGPLAGKYHVIFQYFYISLKHPTQFEFRSTVQTLCLLQGKTESFDDCSSTIRSILLLLKERLRNLMEHVLERMYHIRNKVDHILKRVDHILTRLVHLLRSVDYIIAFTLTLLMLGPELVECMYRDRGIYAPSYRESGYDYEKPHYAKYPGESDE